MNNEARMKIYRRLVTLRAIVNTPEQHDLIDEFATIVVTGDLYFGVRPDWEWIENLIANNDE